MKTKIAQTNSNIRDSVVNDRNSFILFYEKYYQEAYFFACSMLKNETRAYQVVHHTFHHIYHNLDDLNNSSDFTNHVYSIIYEQCSEYFDNDEVFNLNEKINEYLDFAKLEDSYRNSNTLSNRTILIAKLFHHLNNHHIALLVMYFYTGLSKKEIIRILMITPKQFDVILKESKAYLRFTFKNELKRNNKNTFFSFMPIMHGIEIYAKYYTLEPFKALDILGFILDKDVYNFTPNNPKRSVTNNSTVKVTFVAATLSVAALTAIFYYALPSIDQVSVLNDSLTYIGDEAIVSLRYRGNNSLVSKIYAESADGRLIEPFTNSNGEALFSIGSNGTYTFIIKDIGVNLKKSEITIKNIDRTAPRIDNFKYEDSKLIINISDDESGLNVDEVYGLDEQENRIEPLETTSKQVIFEIEDVSTNFKIFLTDNVGNVSSHNVSFTK